MKKLKLPLFIFLSSVAFYILLDGLRGMLGRPFNIVKYLGILLLMAVSLCLHAKKAGPGYGRKLLTGSAGVSRPQRAAGAGTAPTETAEAVPVGSGTAGAMPAETARAVSAEAGTAAAGRVVYMDYLRVLAVVFVIGIHVTESTYKLQLEPHTPAWEALAVLGSLFLTCNLLFIMLSGALLLNGKDEPLLKFYQKRLSRVLIPCVLYYLFYTYFAYGRTAFSPGNWGTLLRDFVSNGNGQTPHFWLVHVILTFYIAAPFLKIMLNHMSDRMLSALVALIFLLHAVWTYAPFFGLQFAEKPFLAYYDAIFILGYFCTRPVSGKYYKLFAAGAALSLPAIALAVHVTDDYAGLLYNNAPPMMLLTCFLFLFFKRHGDTWFKRMPAALAVVSQYSYSILLIHWLILFQIVYARLCMSGLDFGIVGGIPACIFVTLVISLLFAFIFDNTVVLCVDTLFHKVTDRWFGDSDESVDKAR